MTVISCRSPAILAISALMSPEPPLSFVSKSLWTIRRRVFSFTTVIVLSAHAGFIQGRPGDLPRCYLSSGGRQCIQHIHGSPFFGGWPICSYLCHRSGNSWDRAARAPPEFFPVDQKELSLRGGSLRSSPGRARGQGVLTSLSTRTSPPRTILDRLFEIAVEDFTDGESFFSCPLTAVTRGGSCQLYENFRGRIYVRRRICGYG